MKRERSRQGKGARCAPSMGIIDADKRQKARAASQSMGSQERGLKLIEYVRVSRLQGVCSIEWQGSAASPTGMLGHPRIFIGEAPGLHSGAFPDFSGTPARCRDTHPPVGADRRKAGGDFLCARNTRCLVLQEGKQVQSCSRTTPLADFRATQWNLQCGVLHLEPSGMMVERPAVGTEGFVLGY